MYDKTIPYLNKHYSFNHFVVKHEKKLLMAASSKDTNEIINTVLEVVEDCVIQPKKPPVKDLPFFAVDYLFIAMRAKSVGDTIDVEFKCRHDGCNHVFPAQIDILNVEFNRPVEIDKKIALGSPLKGCIMKYPTYAELKSIPDGLDPLTERTMIIARSIDKIWDGEDVNTPTLKEAEEYVDKLSRNQLNKLEEWVTNFPSFHVNVKKKCPKCGFEHSLEFRDFTRFF